MSRPVNIGFTGTQSGLSPDQKQAIYRITSKPELIKSFHHGDCIGADFEAFIQFKLSGAYTVSHPPTNPKKRAFTNSDLEMPPKPYLDRNKAIVNSVDLLIACPKGFHEELRSGTWATIRYAVKKGVEVFIILPNGELERR